MIEKKPRIIIRLTNADYFFEIIGVIGLAFLVFLPVYFYNDLPNQIPKHFNGFGQVDSYGERGTIWLLPAIGLVLYLGLTFLSNFLLFLTTPQK